ncbi:hypothetical protein TeGR_g11489, partial [Tetraparma gracilis]
MTANYLEGKPAILALLMALVFVGMVGHICLFATIKYHQKGRLFSKVSYRLLVLQLMTDFVWCAWLFVRSIYLFSNDWEPPWPDHDPGCTTEGFVLTFCFHVSLYMTALIAYDRFRMVTTPLHPLSMENAMKVYAASVVWALVCSTLHSTVLGGMVYTAGNMYCLVNLWSVPSNAWLFLTLMVPCVAFTGRCYYKVALGLRNMRSKTVHRARTESDNKKRKQQSKEESLARRMCALFV